MQRKITRSHHLAINRGENNSFAHLTLSINGRNVFLFEEVWQCIGRPALSCTSVWGIGDVLDRFFEGTEREQREPGIRAIGRDM